MNILELKAMRKMHKPNSKKINKFEWSDEDEEKDEDFYMKGYYKHNIKC